MTKDERSLIGINKFLKAGAKGTLDYIMRFGKTRIGCKIAERYRTKYEGLIYIIVPSVAVKKEWELELQNFNISNLFIYTATELLNIGHQTVGFVIIDEIHKFTSIRRLKIVNGDLITSDYRLGLTGTYPHDNATIREHYPVVDTITAKEALDNKWISNFIEYNIPLELTNEDKNRYVKYSTIMYEVLSTFKGVYKFVTYKSGTPIFENDLDLILSCYTGKSLPDKTYIEARHIRETVAVRMGWTPELDLTNDYYKQVEEYWNPDTIKDRALKFNRAMRERNEIHNINKVKLDAVMLLCTKFKDRNIIIFNESNMFADTIVDALNNHFKNNKAVAYHSSIPSRPLVNFIDGELFKFKNGKVRSFSKEKQLDYIKLLYKLGVYNVISTSKALNEGFNLEEIDVVITTSGTTNPMTYSQRSARGKTIDKYNKDKITLIFNLYFDNFDFKVDDKIRQFNSRDKAKLAIRQTNTKAIEIDLYEFVENY